MKKTYFHIKIFEGVGLFVAFLSKTRETAWRVAMLRFYGLEQAKTIAYVTHQDLSFQGRYHLSSLNHCARRYLRRTSNQRLACKLVDIFEKLNSRWEMSKLIKI